MWDRALYMIIDKFVKPLNDKEKMDNLQAHELDKKLKSSKTLQEFIESLSKAHNCKAVVIDESNVHQLTIAVIGVLRDSAAKAVLKQQSKKKKMIGSDEESE